MNRLCGHPLSNGRQCAQPLADPTRPDCGRHRDSVQPAPEVVALDEQGCAMRQTGPHSWRCLIHSGAAWETAESLGAEPPCRIPLPDDAKEQLARQPPSTIDAATAKLLARDPHSGARYWIANHPELGPREFDLLSADPDPEVRVALLGGAELPVATLEHLAHDPVMMVQEELARRSHLPESVLELLGDSPHSPVRAAVAAHVDAPTTLLGRLARDPNDYVRWKVIENPRASDEALERLAGDRDPDARRRARSLFRDREIARSQEKRVPL